MIVITPAAESAKACLASRLPSNLLALTANFPGKDSERFLIATSRLDQQFSVGQ
jgi:hypothetical protein